MEPWFIIIIYKLILKYIFKRYNPKRMHKRHILNCNESYDSSYDEEERGNSSVYKNWNGFTGDSGPKLLQIFTIISSCLATLIYINLKDNNFNLFETIANISMVVPSSHECINLICWLIFSWILYALIPGKNAKGPINPSGHEYNYKLNSLACLIILLFLQIFGGYTELLPFELASENTHRIITTMLFGGLLLTCVFYLKGRSWPTWDTSESKPRNNFVEDFCSGIELTPRWRQKSTLDFKLFVIGHLGMMIWALLNFSHAAYGIIKFDNYTPLIIAILQLIYILDWAFYEKWYLYTIDMQHDRLGYLLCFGPITWMPTAYTMYTYYTAHNNTLTSMELRINAILLFLIGYCLFRISNDQKEKFRNDKSYKIWGKPCKYLDASYETADGMKHNSKLLISGFWGWARHFNYIGDWIMCLALSMLCGFDNITSHIYSIQMFFVLIVRAWRDDLRCSRKYGKYWKEYCKMVPYKIIPYIY